MIGADAYPAEWPATLGHLLGLDPAVVVPGHGEPVGASFVRTQRDELHVVAELVRAVSAGELTEDEAARRSPYPQDVTLSALSHTQPAWSDQPTTP